MKPDLKNLIKGKADVWCIKSGGIVTYCVTAEDNTRYLLDIDLSDKNDVGNTAEFMPHYDKAIILMRWIRRAIDNEEIYQI